MIVQKSSLFPAARKQSFINCSSWKRCKRSQSLTQALSRSERRYPPGLAEAGPPTGFGSSVGGKMILPPHGKEFFTHSGKQFFT